MCVDGREAVREVLLPLSLGAAEPAPLTRGATTWLRFLDLCVDGGTVVRKVLLPLSQNRRFAGSPDKGRHDLV